jgi:hypothetical protein
MLQGLSSALGLMWQARTSFTPRKWRLYACACARRLQESGREPLRSAIALVERYADGEASDHELAALRFGSRGHPDSPAAILCWPADAEPWDVVRRFVHWILGSEGGLARWEHHTPYLDLLRELAGPTPAPPPPAPELLAWEAGLLKRMALEAYSANDWARLPVLGDALEDAGCTDEAILSHCRGGSSHVRGCWVVDWLLGRK